MSVVSFVKYTNIVNGKMLYNLLTCASNLMQYMIKNHKDYYYYYYYYYS